MNETAAYILNLILVDISVLYTSEFTYSLVSRILLRYVFFGLGVIVYVYKHIFFFADLGGYIESTMYNIIYNICQFFNCRFTLIVMLFFVSLLQHL